MVETNEVKRKEEPWTVACPDEHTKRFIKIRETGFANGEKVFVVRRGPTEYDKQADMALATELVKRWNCHTDMLEALERIEGFIMSSAGGDALLHSCLVSARTAISKAKGGE